MRNSLYVGIKVYVQGVSVTGKYGSDKSQFTIIFAAQHISIHSTDGPPAFQHPRLLPQHSRTSAPYSITKQTNAHASASLTMFVACNCSKRACMEKSTSNNHLNWISAARRQSGSLTQPKVPSHKTAYSRKRFLFPMQRVSLTARPPCVCQPCYVTHLYPQSGSQSKTFCLQTGETYTHTLARVSSHSHSLVCRTVLLDFTSSRGITDVWTLWTCGELWFKRNNS